MLTFTKYITTLLLIFTLSLNNTYALDCNLDPNNNNSGSVPTTEQILCPILKGINVAIILAGVTFIVMLGYAVVKLALSLGDPKGFQLSQRAAAFAVIGFIIVLGAFTIISIISNTFGLGLTFDITTIIETKLNDMLTFLCTYAPCV